MVLILPFAMRPENDGQETVAADDLELCLVLSLVEAEREKGGGFLKKKTAESISFISKVFWPLFVMKRPEENKYVILDMLGIFEQTFEYKTTPDIPGIIRGLEEHKPSHARCEEYIALLRSYEDSLKDFAGTVVTTLTGCLAHEDLLKDLVDYLRFVDKTAELSEISKISSHLSVEQAEKSLDLLLDLKRKSLRDVESLLSIKNTAFSATFEWKENLTEKQSEILRYFNEKIREITPEVESAVSNHRSQMNSEIQSLELRFSPLISNLQAEVSRWRREEDMYNRLGETHARERDSIRHARKESENQLGKTRREYDDEIRNTKTHYLNLIESEFDRIHSLEKKRDDEIKELEKKKKEIEKKTENLEEKVNKLIQRKNTFISAIDEVGVEVFDIDELLEERFFLYLPMYVANYQADNKSRYLVCPPVIIRGEKKTADKLKGVFGGVTLPIEPRTKQFGKILKKRIEDRIEEDHALKEQMCTKCALCNILDRGDAKDKYLKSLQDLKRSGWIKDKHFEEFTSAFENHFTS